MIEKIRNNPRLKQFVIGLISPHKHPRPRLWVRWFVNPFVHKKGRGALIRRHARLDVFPWRRFEVGRDALIEDYRPATVEQARLAGCRNIYPVRQTPGGLRVPGWEASLPLPDSAEAGSMLGIPAEAVRAGIRWFSFNHCIALSIPSAEGRFAF